MQTGRRVQYATATCPRKEKRPLLSIIQAAGWPIWPLILCSVLALAFIIERAIKLKRSRVIEPGLVDEAISVSRESVPGPDTVNQLAEHSALGEVLASGLRAFNINPRCTSQEVRAAMEGAGREAAHKLERYLPAIATIASAAPLMGLLGTVIGMIEIFGSQAPSGSLSGGNPAQLAHGISVALYNTAFGLMVAIPTLIFWRYFRARVDGYVLELELAAERFARHLDGLCVDGAARPEPHTPPMAREGRHNPESRERRKSRDAQGAAQ
jgi:biopolymer transport protein ExbB